MAKKTKRVEYVISACLLGIPCRWNQKKRINKKALNVFLKGKAIVLCPEIMAGLPTPRAACEIRGGDGKDVLKGKAKIVDKTGRNYTKMILKGSKDALDVVKKYKIKKAILRRGSPTCGTPYIFSGNFSKRKKRGQGVFATLLKQHGIKITGTK